MKKLAPSSNEGTSRGFSVYARGGQWILSFKDDAATGKKWREHRIPKAEANTEKRAEKYAERFIRELHKIRAQGAPAGAVSRAPSVHGPTIRDLADKWLLLRDRDPKVKPATRSQGRSHLRLHVLASPDIADIPIATLGPAVLRAWIREVRDHGKYARDKTSAIKRQGEGLSPATVRNVVSTLRTFLSDAMAEEWVNLPANPVDHPGVQKEVPDLKRQDVVYLSKPSAERLLTCPEVPEVRRVRYLLVLTSGLRDGEVSGLQWQDFDDSAKVLRIERALATVGTNGWASESTTKNESSVRTLPLHRLAERALRTWRSTGWVHRVGRHPKPTDPIFPNAAGEAHRPNSAELLRKDLETAGLPSEFRAGVSFDFHATRRSFYTWLRNEGVAKDTVDMLMGHAGGSVGERHYGAKDLERMRKAVETITLDLSTGDVIHMPIKRVQNGAVSEISDPETVGLPADLPASFPRAGLPAGTDRAKLRETRSRFRELNSRPTVYETVALPLS
jgi:integrase